MTSTHKNKACTCREDSGKCCFVGDRIIIQIRNRNSEERLENCRKCCQKSSMWTIEELLSVCEENPDCLINMFRLSRINEKCLPKISLNTNKKKSNKSVNTKKEKIVIPKKEIAFDTRVIVETDEGPNGQKYHYLMVDDSTSCKDASEDKFSIQTLNESPISTSTSEEAVVNKTKLSEHDSGILVTTDNKVEEVKRERSSLKKSGTFQDVGPKKSFSFRRSQSHLRMPRSIVWDEDTNTPTPKKDSILSSSSHILSLLHYVIKKENKRDEKNKHRKKFSIFSKHRRRSSRWFSCFKLCRKKPQRRSSQKSITLSEGDDITNLSSYSLQSGSSTS